MQQAQEQANEQSWRDRAGRPQPFHRDRLTSTKSSHVEHLAGHGKDCNEGACHNHFFYFCNFFASVFRKLDNILCLRLQTACWLIPNPPATSFSVQLSQNKDSIRRRSLSGRSVINRLTVLNSWSTTNRFSTSSISLGWPSD